MVCKVLIAESAIADLCEIVEFVAQDDPEAAKRLGNKLLDSAASLSTMPARFPFHDAKRGIHKMTVAPYLVFYVHEESKEVVDVLHFWHGARSSPSFGS